MLGWDESGFRFSPNPVEIRIRLSLDPKDKVSTDSRVCRRKSVYADDSPSKAGQFLLSSVLCVMKSMAMPNADQGSGSDPLKTSMNSMKKCVHDFTLYNIFAKPAFKQLIMN